jgi:vacuolar-type H+-ATPase subunit I/STV1
MKPKSKIEAAVDLLLPTKLKILSAINESTAAPSVSSSNAATNDGNLGRNIDHLWKDIRAIFKLADKSAIGIAKVGEGLTVTKAGLLAAFADLRHIEKENSSEIKKLQKELETTQKALAKNQEEIIKVLQETKKMIDLYMNPPAQMGPLSRATLTPMNGKTSRKA